MNIKEDTGGGRERRNTCWDYKKRVSLLCSTETAAAAAGYKWTGDFFGRI